MDFFLFWPNYEKIRAAGFANLAHIPCVFDGEWRYHSVGSSYLKARAFAEVTSSGGRPMLVRIRYPSRLSLRTFGEMLVNFLEWCDVKGKLWQTLDYTEGIVFGYQRDMSDGSWSVRGEPLMPNTINTRVMEACRFLEWAASIGARKPFDVPRLPAVVDVSSPTSTRKRNRRIVLIRAGAVRPHPMILRIPTDEEIAHWLRSVRFESGVTKALMCELVMATAIRREEVVQWQVDTLPVKQEEWVIAGDYVTVAIRHGTKGPKLFESTHESIGPTRYIQVPLSVATCLHEYRQRVRPKLLSRYVSAASSVHEKRQRMLNATKRLFLSDYTGEPVSAHRFYLAWAHASVVPFRGWSPHGGRHWWVCKTLLQMCSLRIASNSLNPTYGDVDGPLSATAEDLLRTLIKPQLGHVSERATEAYLVWLRQVVSSASLSDDYEKALESVVEAAEDG
ncbi:hypothetical protein BCO18430_06024 [Burkholderia contaminans]|nr:hypothetical protein BCO18430_06024 [Burkholderia contaminans]